MKRLLQFCKDPFFQFLALGVVVFAVYGLSKSARQDADKNRIVIDGPTQVWLYDNFKKQFGRAPSRPEMGALIKSHIDQEVKSREALAMGLDQGDSIVQRRMVQKFEFIFGSEAADATPDDAALEAWHREHIEEFTFPGVITFSQLWFSPDERGGAAEADARAALAALNAGENVNADRFPLGERVENATSAEVRAMFGPEFARAVFDLPLDSWAGPLKSGLGVHLVRVTAMTRPEPIAFTEVREDVLARWRESESARLLSETVAELKSGYEVEIDEQALVGLEYSPDEVPPYP
jgi:hypothetical protein